MHKSKRAFTLIELLVVIAIIAILAAILFPVFAQAKAAAKKTVDLSNMKQIDLGVLIYTNDYDDHYMYADMITPQFANNPAHYGYMYRWSSAQVLGPYLKNVQLFLSPLDSAYTVNNYGNAPIPSTRVDSDISYMANALSPDRLGASGSVYFPAGVTDYRGPISVGNYWGGFDPTTFTPTTGSVSTTEAANPTSLIVFTGGSVQADALAYCPNSTGTERIAGCYGDGDLFFGWDAASFASGTYFGGTSTAAFTAWRKAGNGSNFAFSDGHAKTMQPGGLLTGPFQLNPKYFLVSYTGN